MRFAPVFAVFLSAILPLVLATPILPRVHAHDISFNTRSPESQPAVNRQNLLGHSVEGNAQVYDRDLRELEVVYRRVAEVDQVRRSLSEGKVSPGRPANAKITFGNAARAKLDELGLHGKARKRAKQYHKNIVKQDMKAHPGAATARIFHLAHEGGNDPNERNHITAGYYSKSTEKGEPGEQIRSPWSKKFEAENPGKTTKGLFHVYPADQKRTHVPAAWKNAVAASAERKKQEEAKAAEKAEAEKKEKRKRVEQEILAGQSLSQDAKKAQREAAKAAKAQRRRGK